MSERNELTVQMAGQRCEHEKQMGQSKKQWETNIRSILESELQRKEQEHNSKLNNLTNLLTQKDREVSTLKSSYSDLERHNYQQEVDHKCTLDHEKLSWADSIQHKLQMSLDQKDRERETAIANKTQEHQTALEILSEKMARDSELIQHHEAKGFSFIEQIKGKH